MKMRDKYCKKHPHFSKIYCSKIYSLDFNREKYLFNLLNQYRDIVKKIDVENLLLNSETNEEFYEKLLNALSLYFTKQFLKQELVLSQKLFINNKHFLDFYLKKLKTVLCSLFLEVLHSQENIRVFKKFISVTISKYNSREGLLRYFKKIKHYQKEQKTLRNIKEKHFIIDGKMYALCSGKMLDKVPLTWCIFSSPVSWEIEKRDYHHVLIYDLSKSIFDKEYAQSFYFKKHNLEFDGRVVNALNKSYVDNEVSGLKGFIDNLKMAEELLPKMVGSEKGIDISKMNKIANIHYKDYNDFVLKFEKKYKNKVLPLKMIDESLNICRKKDEMDIYYFMMNKVTSKQLNMLMVTQKFTEDDLNNLSSKMNANKVWKKMIKNIRSFNKNIDG